MTDGLIAVTAATGGMGGRVARRLAQRGVPQRLVVRDAGRAPQLAEAEVVAARGYEARAEMEAALDGVDTLFLVPANETADRVERHRAAVDAAVAAGVRRIVYLSFLACGPDATFTFARDHWHTEQHVRAAGVAFTFVRMSLYLDFLPNVVGRDGVIRGPAGEGRFAPVLRDDLADVVAAVLLGGDHDGATYDVTGPAALTLPEAAATLTRLGGVPIAFEDETLEEAYASRAGYGAPDWEVAGWVSTYTAIRSGELDVVTDTVERLAGHPPVGLEAFVRTHPEALAHVVRQ
jgi:uncharacterized protein YbjT (DUF2867 family)